MNADLEDYECPHLHLVGDSQCRLCLEPVEGTILPDEVQGMDAEGVDWGEMADPEAVASWTPDDVGTKVAPPVTYPEYAPLPEAPISVNFKPTGEPMITVRGNCAADVTAALNDLEACGTYANIAAAQSMLQAQGPLGGILGPVTPVSPQAPPPGLPAGPPQAPPPFGPNVSVPTAPQYQGPPAPQQYAPQAPPAPSWGGQGGGGNSGPQPPSERPPGWHVVDVPWAMKDQFKDMRANPQFKDYVRGKIRWGGKGIYFLEPSISAWIAQQGYPVTT